VRSARSLVILTALACLGGLPTVAHSQLNVLCSAPADWCKLIAEEFGKETGIKVATASNGGRAALASLAEQKGKPQADVWFGGSTEAHLRATKFGLVDEYASPMVAQLQPWAQKVAEQSKSTSFGAYARVVGIGYNSALATQKKLAPPACWKDLVKPGYAGEVHIANPNATGSTYFAIAAMAQLFGEEEAFKYLKTMYKAPPPSKRGRAVEPTAVEPKAGAPKAGAPKAGEPKAGAPKGATMPPGATFSGRAAAAGPNAAKTPPPVGNAIAGIGYVGDIVAEAEGGAPVKVVVPCEGTVYEVGAVSIVKGARNLDNAKKFVDWVLSAKGQGLAAKAKQHLYPANTAVPTSALAPKFGEIKFISYDVARFEKTEARRHLVDRWKQEFGAPVQ